MLTSSPASTRPLPSSSTPSTATRRPDCGREGPRARALGPRLAASARCLWTRSGPKAGVWPCPDTPLAELLGHLHAPRRLTRTITDEPTRRGEGLVRRSLLVLALVIACPTHPGRVWRRRQLLGEGPSVAPQNAQELSVTVQATDTGSCPGTPTCDLLAHSRSYAEGVLFLSTGTAGTRRLCGDLAHRQLRLGPHHPSRQRASAGYCIGGVCRLGRDSAARRPVPYAVPGDVPDRRRRRESRAARRAVSRPVGGVRARPRVPDQCAADGGDRVQGRDGCSLPAC